MLGVGVEAEPQTRKPQNPRLIALTPRQVLLANPKMGKSLTSTDSNHKDYETILHHSIAQYLQHYGFCKTLKKFRSEAHLLEDYQKNMVLDLEEICIKYLETISNAIANAKGVEQGKLLSDAIPRLSGGRPPAVITVCMNGKGEGEAGSKLESLSKKKKKRHEGSSDAAIDNSEPVGKSTTHDEGMANGQAPEKVKSKEKKKNKRLSDSIKAPSLEDSKQSVNGVFKSEDLSIKKKEKQSKKSVVVSESQTETVKEQSKASETREVAFSEVDKKSKDKKKRKSKELDQEDDAKTLGEIPEHGEDKGLKKRKRAEPGEDHSMLGDKSASDESKRRKTDSVKEENSSTQQAKLSENSDGGEENNGQDVHASPDTLHKTPSKQLDSEENGNSENGGTPATQRSSRKQHKGSAEPSTTRAFQRIKVEEVEFADEKLKDNSYWAKDGAESGYGAKAQGILGQVRGRGFRHEKTKKKRGSYRGGQIDLQSHSVKFNYSDDEE